MIDLGKKRLRLSNIDLINGSDDDSVMSNVMSMTNLTDPTAYSKDKLVEILQNARILHRSSHHKSSDNGGSSSDNDDSDLSSTSSEEENSESDVASSR